MTYVCSLEMEEQMPKKYYLQLAKMLYNYKFMMSDDVWSSLVTELSVILKKENLKFDSVKFRAACNGEFK